MSKFIARVKVRATTYEELAELSAVAKASMMERRAPFHVITVDLSAGIEQALRNDLRAGHSGVRRALQWCPIPESPGDVDAGTLGEEPIDGEGPSCLRGIGQWRVITEMRPKL